MIVTSIAGSKTALVSLAKSPLTRHVILQTVCAISGGGTLSLQDPSAVIDPSSMDRIKLRLEGLGSYSVIAALMMNVCMRLFSSTSKNVDPSSDRDVNVAKVIFCTSVVTSIVTGTYTSVVFAMLGLYYKTALGMGIDQNFLDYFAQTTWLRKQAFDSFVISLLTFEVSFISSLYINYRGKLKWLATLLATVLAIYSFYHWGLIMQIASKLIYAKAQNEGQ